MDYLVPYQRIRDFESQAIQKFLENERTRSQRGFGDYVVEAEPDNPHQNDSSPGEYYNKNVDLMLESIGLSKYIENFKTFDVGVNVLIHMDENDLAEIGITDYMDQALFQRQLRDLRGNRTALQRNVYKVEEDLIMAKNIYTHLIDINAHLNSVQHHLIKNEFEDYFVSPRKSILSVFNMVIDRALVQAKKMSDVLFKGKFDSNELVPALLKADDLELPDFMIAKLYKPDKNFKIKPKKTNLKSKKIKTMAAISLGITTAAVLIFNRFLK